MDVYFPADVETDGPIPGPYSLLSFALVYAGAFNGQAFQRPASYEQSFHVELKPISERFDSEALQISGLDRARLEPEGRPPAEAMNEASRRIQQVAGTLRRAVPGPETGATVGTYLDGPGRYRLASGYAPGLARAPSAPLLTSTWAGQNPIRIPSDEHLGGQRCIRTPSDEHLGRPEPYPHNF